MSDQNSVLIAQEKMLRPPRWHYIYFLLAGFDLLTVLFSLLISYRIVHIYQASVAENQSWVEYQRLVNMLSDQATELNAPGNNVFETNDIAGEENKLRLGIDSFDEHLTTFDSLLRTGISASNYQALSENLRPLKSMADKMATESKLVFASLRDNHREQATKHMAVMDRYLSQIHRVLDQLREKIGIIQREMFDRQTNQAALLQRFEYVIGALMIIMVVGAVLYAQRIRRLAEWQEQQKETMRAASARASLLKQIMLTQEEERRNLARELHDGIGQSLTSLLVGLRALSEAQDMTTVSQNAKELRQVASSTLQEIRSMARGLRPSVLDDLGLAAALERFAEDYQKVHGTPVELQLDDLDASRVPMNVELALYRIIQEALTNISKYAQAKYVRIALEHESDSVRAYIEDDGQGFDVEQALQGDAFGLISMRERANLVGGDLSFHSQPGEGTMIAVSIPLTENAHGQDQGADRG